MYHPSPIRVNHQIPSVSRSVSPVSQIKIVGNTSPAPPGMKTILKPKIYEAVDIPYSSYVSMPVCMPQSIDHESQRRIKQLEMEVQQYRVRTEQMGSSEQQISQLLEKLRTQQIEIDRFRNDSNGRLLQEQCEYYFNQFQQCELEKNELLHRVKMHERNNGEYDQKINKVVQEVEQWKKKYHQSEQQNTTQIQQLKEEFERIYSQHYQGLAQSAEQKCKVLENQILKYQNQLEDVERQSESWRQRYHEGDLGMLTYTQKINELELMTSHQQKELERLNSVNQQKSQEIDQFKQRLNYFEFNHSAVTQQGFESEIKRLKEQLDSRQKEIDDLKRRNYEVEQTVLRLKEAQIELDILKTKNYQTESQLQDSDRYKHMNSGLQLELEEQKQKHQRLENIINEMKRNEFRFSSETQRMGDLLRLKDEEISKMQLDYKKNMQQMQNQINQFRTIYEKDINQVRETRSRSEMEGREQNDSRILKQQQELDEMKRERESLHQTCAQLSQTKLQLENKILIMTGEIDRLNQVINQKAEELGNFKESLNLTSEQVESLRQQNELLKREIDLFKTRSSSKVFNSSQKKFDLPSHQHQDSNWN